MFTEIKKFFSKYSAFKAGKESSNDVTDDPMYKFVHMKSKERKKFMKIVVEGATRRQMETLEKARAMRNA